MYTRLISICKCTTGFGVYINIINQMPNHIETGMHHSPGCNYPVYWWENYWLTTVPSKQVVPYSSPDYSYSTVCNVHLYSSRAISSEMPSGSPELTLSHSWLFTHFHSSFHSFSPSEKLTLKIKLYTIKYGNFLKSVTDVFAHKYVCLVSVYSYHVLYILIL